MKRKGFTLVEILIVVIILGILAAIVIPQFTEASKKAKQSALQSDLQMVRSQLELYKTEHNDKYPDGADSAAWAKQLTSPTDVDGVIVAATVENHFGPYMHSFPKNQFSAADQDVVTFVTGATATCPGTEGTGWWFNSTTGEFRAASSADDAKY